MLLDPGARLGPYEIVASIGAGGMGAVYKATDTRLGRDVAIKVSAEKFSERFEREARAISSLNHLHICTLYDVGPNYLVMELVEGETLHGPMPIPEALSAARQIVEALEAAHEKGITHRDLKPGNIKIKPDGTVKVLDFGLAKVTPASPEDFENSPTLSIAATGAGVILGTAAYMAPEQARGMPVDKRADIWAFGVVLYELLTGKQLFTGETTTDILAAVVRAEPDFTALPESTPASIRRLLKRCLEKDRKKRLPDIGVAKLEIDDALIAPEPITEVATSKRQSMLPWLVAAFAVLALVAVSWYGFRPQPDSHWIGTRLSESVVAMSPRISPDGQLLAFLAMIDGLTQVAVMKPESGNWTVLTHDRSRGLANNICWSRDGTKLYLDRFQDAPGGIFSVPVLGGEEQLVVEDAASPQVLPDGSFLIQRLNSERRYQLHRYWPESGRVQALKVLLPATVSNSPPFRTTPGGDRVAFFGKPLDDAAAPDHLYVLDLGSEKITRLAPGVSFGTIGPGGGFFPLVSAADGRSVFVDLPSDDTHRIVSVPLDGAGKLRTILTLTNYLVYFDMGSDGSLYLDQWDRPAEVLRVSPDGGTPEHVAMVTSNPTAPPQALPLPDGRLVYNSHIAGRDRLLLITSGKEPVPFVETQEETAAPTALVGQTQIAFLIGPKSSRTIGLASLRDRRITRRLEGSRGAAIDSMVSSSDGKTIYYAASGSIWTISVDDGQPQKLRNGDSVTIDPYRKELIIRMTETGGTRLVRVPIGGGAEGPIALKGDVRVSPYPYQSNAVSKDGRIVVQVAPSASWFWPLVVIEPDTGRVQVVHVGYDADMNGGWSPDGKLVVVAQALRSSLWRFRPETAASK